MRLKIIVLLVLSLVLVIPVNAQGQQPVCFLYQVEAIGTVEYDGNVTAFNQFGVVAVSTRPLMFSFNDIDIAVQFGQPVSAPEVGSLFFTSNGFFAGSFVKDFRNGATDIAFTNATMTPLGTFSMVALLHERVDFYDYGNPQGAMVNVFNVESGITANPKTATNGSVNVRINRDGSLSGEINLRGKDWLSAQAEITYTADFTGQLALASPMQLDCVSPVR